MKKTKHFQIIAGVLIFTIIIIFVSIRRKEGPYRSPVKLTELPKFVSVDVNGAEVRSKDFKGKNLFVQFIDPRNKMDIKLFKDVYSNWKEEDLSFLLIVKEFDRFNSRVEINTDNIIILTKDFDELESIFNPRKIFGTHYYLVNNAGKIVASGSNNFGYENGPKVFLKQLIKNEYFSISSFINLYENIRDIKWLNQIAEIADAQNKDYYVISMFTSICSGCFSGELVFFLNEFYNKNQNNIHVLCILNDKFNDRDITRLKSQLKINLPVIIANDKLSQKWNSLIKEFRENDLTNIMFILNKSGIIIKVYDESCKCWNQFSRFLKSLEIQEITCLMY